MYFRLIIVMVLLGAFSVTPASAIKLHTYSSLSAVNQELKKNKLRLPIAYYSPDGKSLARALDYLLPPQYCLRTESLRSQINQIYDEIKTQPLPTHCRDYGETFNDWRNADSLIYALVVQRLLQNLSINRPLIVYTLSRQEELFAHIYYSQEVSLQSALNNNPIVLFFNAQDYVFMPVTGADQQVPGLTFVQPFNPAVVNDAMMIGALVIFSLIVYLVVSYS